MEKKTKQKSKIFLLEITVVEMYCCRWVFCKHCTQDARQAIKTTFLISKGQHNNDNDFFVDKKM